LTTPAWSAAQNGQPGNLNATNQAGQIDQFLGTHASNVIYGGTPIYTSNGVMVGPPATTMLAGLTWYDAGSTVDVTQPFTMSGTTIGHVVVPVQASGAGANMRVILCPDSGGNPNLAAAITSTVVPAAYINSVSSPNGPDPGLPLATPWTNITYPAAPPTFTPWAPATTAATGIGNDAGYAIDTANGIAVFVGGTPAIDSTALVFTVAVIDDVTLTQPIPQPSIPTRVSSSGVVICNGTIIVAGGVTYTAGVPTALSLVYAASYDGGTGNIGSWSLQTSLPQTIYQPTMVTYGNFIYVIGGITTFAGTYLSTVYVNSVNNGQLGAWQSLTPYPIPISLPYAAVIGNLLVVAGGNNPAGLSISTSYYAKINADGTIGGWNAAPPLPVAASCGIVSGGTTVFSTDDTMVCFGGTINTPGLTSNTPQIQIIGATASGGIGSYWSTINWDAINEYGLVQQTGAGTWNLYQIEASVGYYEASKLVTAPQISVPLYATGLSNGATYHIVVQQTQTSSSSDFLSWGLVSIGSVSGFAKTSTRNANSWSNILHQTLGISVFDTSIGLTDLARHVVTDINSYGVTQQWSTLLYNSDKMLIGELSNTLEANNPLNSNPTFTSGVSPWTVTGGTFTQSAVQTHGGFPFSGLLTPNGIATLVFASSEQVPINDGNGPFAGINSWYLADGWFYSTPGTTDFSLSVNWFDRSGGYMSTSSKTVSLTAATWTHLQNYFLAPENAAFAAIVPTEGSTPANTKVVYFSDVFLIQSWECVSSFTSAATVNYASGTIWPPTGVTQLI
jgi:hypothetical protein